MTMQINMCGVDQANLVPREAMAEGQFPSWPLFPQL